MNFPRAIAILVTGVFALPMVDRLVHEAPGLPSSIDGLFIGVDQAPRLKGSGHDGLDRFLLPIRYQVQHDFPSALSPAQDRWFVAG